MSEANPSAEAAKDDVVNNDGPVVEFKDVTISFDVKPVLLKLANGLLKADSGSIKIFGQEITTMPEVDLYKLRAHIGMVFQESALFDSIDVEDNVAYRLHQENVPEDEAHNRVQEALKFVELEQAIDKFPSELSGGMRRRVSIARAIISGPDLILYDSPTGGLDPITSTTIIQLVMKQRDVSHTTSIIVTHRLQDAFVMATHKYDEKAGMVELPKENGHQTTDDSTKFLMLNEGGVVFHGTTHELVSSTDPWIKEYLS